MGCPSLAASATPVTLAEAPMGVAMPPMSVPLDTAQVRVCRSMPKVSAIARSLQNKGLVRWTHDGNGEEGTYILLTDTAVTSVQAHRQTLRAYHQRVVAAYGEEKFLHLLGEIAQLEEIMRQEAEKVGGAHDHA